MKKKINKKAVIRVDSNKWTQIERIIIGWIAQHLQVPYKSLKRTTRLADLQNDFSILNFSSDIEKRFDFEFKYSGRVQSFVTLNDILSSAVGCMIYSGWCWGFERRRAT